jgi:hypothetical protein
MSKFRVGDRVKLEGTVTKVMPAAVNVSFDYREETHGVVITETPVHVRDEFCQLVSAREPQTGDVVKNQATGSTLYTILALDGEEAWVRRHDDGRTMVLQKSGLSGMR